MQASISHSSQSSNAPCEYSASTAEAWIRTRENPNVSKSISSILFRLFSELRGGSVTRIRVEAGSICNSPHNIMDTVSIYFCNAPGVVQ